MLYCIYRNFNVIFTLKNFRPVASAGDWHSIDRKFGPYRAGSKSPGNGSKIIYRGTFP